MGIKGRNHRPSHVLWELIPYSLQPSLGNVSERSPANHPRCPTSPTVMVDTLRRRSQEKQLRTLCCGSEAGSGPRLCHASCVAGVMMGHYSSARAMRAMMMNEKGVNESTGKRTSGENLGMGNGEGCN